MFRPPSVIVPQIVPTAANTPAGQPGLLRPSRTRFVTSPRIGYANRPTTGNWRYGDLHPARLRPCRLLLSHIRLVWGFLCQGGVTPFLSSFVIPFFCSTCAASILSSRPHICIAVARSGSQGRRFFSAAEGLSLTDASAAAGC